MDEATCRIFTVLVPDTGATFNRFNLHRVLQKFSVAKNNPVQADAIYKKVVQSRRSMTDARRSNNRWRAKQSNYVSEMQSCTQSRHICVGPTDNGWKIVCVFVKNVSLSVTRTHDGTPAGGC